MTRARRQRKAGGLPAHRILRSPSQRPSTVENPPRLRPNASDSALLFSPRADEPNGTRIDHKSFQVGIVQRVMNLLPPLPHRLKRFRTLPGFPKAFGQVLPRAPVRTIQNTASMKKRLSLALRPGLPGCPGSRSLMRLKASSEMAERCMAADWRR